MNLIRKRFTKWYIKRGYTFEYNWVLNNNYTSSAEEYFVCPLWVKPLLIFFSPSVYCAEVIKPNFIKALRERDWLTVVEKEEKYE